MMTMMTMMMMMMMMMIDVSFRHCLRCTITAMFLLHPDGPITQQFKASPIFAQAACHRLERLCRSGAGAVFAVVLSSSDGNHDPRCTVPFGHLRY